MLWFLACLSPETPERPDLAIGPSDDPPADSEDSAADSPQDSPADDSEAPEETGQATPWVAITSPERCQNPCTLQGQGSEGLSLAWSADGWSFGEGSPLTYTFSRIGPRELVLSGQEGGQEQARDEQQLTVLGACPTKEGTTQESAPVQLTGAGLPSGAQGLTWQVPAASTSIAPFSGSPGSPASHEGIDYVHADASQASVDVVAASDGVVVYVRDGCPQSTTFGSNQSLRECGAGWGNHVVLRHPDGVTTRYAHLLQGSVPWVTGEPVQRGQVLGTMGNSGRSDVRHLHFELGAASEDPDPCGQASSFDAVYDPALLGL